MQTAIVAYLSCLLVLLTTLWHPGACKPTTTFTTSTQYPSTSSPKTQVITERNSYRSTPMTRHISAGDDMESMETAHTLIYGTSGAPYLCLPANPPQLSFSRRSGGAYKKKPRRGYSKYPWNYQ